MDIYIASISRSFSRRIFLFLVTESLTENSKKFVKFDTGIFLENFSEHILLISKHTCVTVTREHELGFEMEMHDLVCFGSLCLESNLTGVHFLVFQTFSSVYSFYRRIFINYTYTFPVAYLFILMYIRDRNSTYIITATKGIYHFTSATQMKAFFRWKRAVVAEILIFCLSNRRKNRIFVQKSNFCPKIEVLFKNRSFVQKSKFYPKIYLLDKKRCFLQKYKCRPKILKKIIRFHEDKSKNNIRYFHLSKKRCMPTLHINIIYYGVIVWGKCANFCDRFF